MLSDGTEGIRLEDDRITWKVPALFDNDWVALHLSHELAPLLGRPLFDIAYGSPLCAWAGGRPPRMIAPLSEDEMRRRFEAYRKVGARCAFTFSRIDAGKYVDDSYCNMLLSLLDEYGGQAIVADDGLARHIRDTHPAVSLVCSNVKVVLDHHVGFHGQDEESYYRSLLGLYDEVVVRTEALLEGGVTDRLQDLADRVELIVNERCAVDCPYAAEHIALAVVLEVAHGDDGDLLAFMNPNHPKGRVDMTIKLSEDEGQTWPRELTLYRPGGLGYSCLVKLDDDTLGAFYETMGGLVFQRVKIADIPSKAK